MDIFKLIFQHDIRLDQLRKRHVDRDTQETSSRLEDFLKPDPTYSKFYFSGTAIAAADAMRFGLSCLSHAEELVAAIVQSLAGYELISSLEDSLEDSRDDSWDDHGAGNRNDHGAGNQKSFENAVWSMPMGGVLLLGPAGSISSTSPVSPNSSITADCSTTANRSTSPASSGLSTSEADILASHLAVGHDENAGHKKEAIASTLEKGILVLYKEQAHDGFDLHLFSKKNIYRDFFWHLKPMVSESLRFFSMNGKRITSERKFYFETWALEQPPHGIEEVFRETVL